MISSETYSILEKISYFTPEVFLTIFFLLILIVYLANKSLVNLSAQISIILIVLLEIFVITNITNFKLKAKAEYNNNLSDSEIIFKKLIKNNKYKIYCSRATLETGFNKAIYIELKNKKFLIVDNLQNCETFLQENNKYKDYMNLNQIKSYFLEELGGKTI